MEEECVRYSQRGFRNRATISTNESTTPDQLRCRISRIQILLQQNRNFRGNIEHLKILNNPEYLTPRLLFELYTFNFQRTLFEKILNDKVSTFDLTSNENWTVLSWTMQSAWWTRTKVKRIVVELVSIILRNLMPSIWTYLLRYLIFQTKNYSMTIHFMNFGGHGHRMNRSIK